MEPAVVNFADSVTSAPEKVKAVVALVPDLITNSLPEFCSLPNSVPASLKIISWSFASIITSPSASSVILPLELICKFVPSPSIFSPSSPNVNPMFAGMFTSAPAVRLMSPVPCARSEEGEVKRAS